MRKHKNDRYFETYSTLPLISFVNPNASVPICTVLYDAQNLNLNHLSKMNLTIFNDIHSIYILQKCIAQLHINNKKKSFARYTKLN